MRINEINNKIITVLRGLKDQSDKNIFINVFGFFNPIKQDVSASNLIKGFPCACVFLKDFETQELTNNSVERKYQFNIEILYKLDKTTPEASVSAFYEAIDKTLNALDDTLVKQEISMYNYPTTSENDVIETEDGVMMSQTITIGVSGVLSRSN